MKLSEVKTNELEIRNYDVRQRYSTDWITEFTFISEKNLTLDQFQVVLEGKGAYGDPLPKE